jgi:endonuclease/exonuclease/phosphatase family metal-dependent hydrolase
MTTMRLLTWNTWGKNADWRAREDALLAAMADADADIVTVQEAWTEPSGSTQTARLAAALGFAHHHQADPPQPVRERGLGVLARWPITRHDTIELTAGGEPGEHRIALLAIIATPAGNLPLLTTHLNWRPDHSAVRQQQARQLLHVTARQADQDTLPTVICGDLNAAPESDEIRMLTGLTATPVPGIVFQDAWTAGGDGTSGHTWSHANPHAARERYGPARIDYVLVQWRPGQPGAVLATTVVSGYRNGIWPSDHAGVATSLIFGTDST